MTDHHPSRLYLTEKETAKILIKRIVSDLPYLPIASIATTEDDVADLHKLNQHLVEAAIELSEFLTKCQA